MHIDDFFKPLLNEGRYDIYSFKAIFVSGAPGCGKTTIEHRLGLQTLGLKSLDLDQTIRYLKAISRTPAESKNLVNYERAQNATFSRFKMWATEHLGLIIQTTGRNEGDIISLNKLLSDNYYNTFMLMVRADEEIARERIQSRPISTNNPADKGRIVDMSFFNSAYAAVQKNISLYDTLFGDNFALVENNGLPEDRQSFQSARSKLNNFLSEKVMPEASVFLKGVRQKRRSILGRKFTSE